MTAISKTKLASLLGITARRVEQLAADEVLVRVGDGFDLEESVRQYCEFLRRDEQTRAERRKLLAAQTRATMLRAKRQTGELLTRKEVRRRLDPLLDDLWALRGWCTTFHGRMEGFCGNREAARVAYCNAHSEMSYAIAKWRDDLLARFADIPARDLDAELARLGVEEAPVED